jgi:3-methyladenine DNA glycosylase AlkD
MSVKKVLKELGKKHKKVVKRIFAEDDEFEKLARKKVIKKLRKERIKKRAKELREFKTGKNIFGGY